MAREYETIGGLPSAITPLTGAELVEIEQSGVSHKVAFSELGGVPGAHATTHRFGGTDPVGTQDKTANSIPVTDGSGTLDVFVSEASTTVKGKVQLATEGESAANKAVQSNDSRMSNARTPTAHAASHLGGSDTLGLGTAAFLNSGVAGGVCPLNGSAQVDSSYLPSYVDDVIEVANYAALPVTGETGKIYVTLDDNLTYRWSGSTYIEISKSLALGETSTTAYRGDRGKTAYDHSQLVTGNPHGTAIADISTLSGKITPLSHLFRVMQLNGDGVPTFPDNVAGRTYWHDKDWTVTTGWTGGTGVTLSIENSMLKVVPTTAGVTNANSLSSTYQNKLVRIIINSTIPLTNIYTVTGSTVFTIMKNFTSLGGGRYSADILWSRTGSDNFVIWPDYGLSTLPTWYLESIYIGSGANDTPVYDKACCNRFTNNGVLPVKGTRGQALALYGNGSLVGDNPAIGTSGTLAFWGKRRTIGTDQYVFNNATNPTSGLNFRFDTSNVLRFSVFNGTVYGYGTYALTDTASWHPIVITYNASALIFNVDGVDVETVSSPQVPAMATAVLTMGSSLNADISMLTYDTAIWTLAQKQRFANGDDAVDSQQKAVTPVGHSIAIRKSDGRTEVATGTVDLDAVNKAQMDTAIAALLTTIQKETYTAADTFTINQLGYLGSDGQVHLFDASAESTAKGALYIATTAITATASGVFQRAGEITTTGLTAFATYYGSETAGAYTTTAPTTSAAVVRVIGYAQSTTVLYFNPSNDYVVLV